jgi:hypothetical protein
MQEKEEGSSGQLRRAHHGGNNTWTGEPVRTTPLWHGRGTVAARQRVAWRVAPGGDGALMSGPSTEREKLTVGSRMTDIPELKTLPKRK